MATNTITDKNTLKSWFKRGLKPLEAHFHAWMDAYWHKSEKIPTSSIEGLEKTLNSKAESFAVESAVKELQTHRQDTAAHKTENEQAKLNNLADDPNITYATKEELEASGAIVIPVDFTIPSAEREAGIITFVQPYIENGDFFSKPIFANYIWKEDYGEGGDNMEQSLIVPGTPYQKSPLNIGYSFNYPISVYAIDDGGTEMQFILRIYLYRRKLEVEFDNYEIPAFDSILFLYDFEEGFIGTADGCAGAPFTNWDRLFKYLELGFYPVLYFKTKNTDLFVPASYHFEKVEDYYVGKIEIQYLKSVNGEKQLWVEHRIFNKEDGGFKGIGSNYEVPEEGLMGEGLVQKISLEKEYNYLNVDLNLMTEAEGLQTQALKDDLERQIMEFNVNLPILVKFKFSQGYYYVLSDRYNGIVNEYGESQIAYGHEIKISIENSEIEKLLKGNSLNINLIYVKDKGSIINKAMGIEKLGYKFSKTIFLYEDSDHFISSLDKISDYYMFSSWNSFYEELRKGCLPAIYLKSLESDCYCPAIYEFLPTSENLDRFNGYIEISYFKQIDGKNYLCREKRIFENANFGNSTIFHGTGENRSFVVEKFPLDPNVSLVTEYPEDLSSYPDGSIFIKQEIV